MGSELKQGNHFATTVVDFESKQIFYGDSLGWSAPPELISFVEKCTSALSENISDFEFIYCHKPSDTFGHVCSQGCSKNFPFQRDGNICGIVAMIVLATAALTKKLYSAITEKGNNVDNCYLANPTRYARYLRSVVIIT